MKSGHAGTPLKRRWNGRPRPACRGPSCLASGAPWPRRPGHLLRAGLRRQSHRVDGGQREPAGRAAGG